MARRNPQSLGNVSASGPSGEKRERKQQKKAAAAEARSGQPAAPGTDPQSEDPTLSDTEVGVH
jgi:hypothetical protein